MSSDSIPGYELLTRVSEGSVRTYHALSRTGAVVMVHFVEDAGDIAARVREMIDRLPPQERRKVLEIVEARGGAAVVTKFILDFDSLLAWLDDRVPDPPSRSVGDHAGGFTEAFRALDSPPQAPGDSTPSSVPEPGEFTRAFQAIRSDDHHVLPSEPPSDSSGPPPPAGGEPLSPGAPSLPGGGMSSAESEAPDSLPAEPGEFTRAFRAIADPPMASRPADAAPEPAPPRDVPAAVPPPPPVNAEPGEFTRLFGAVQPPPAGTSGPAPDLGAPGSPPPQPPPQPVVGRGDATSGRVDPLPAPNLGVPGSGTSSPPGAKPPAVRWDEPLPPASGGPSTPAASPPAPGPDSGPGEFTRMFGRVDAPSAPVPPGAQSLGGGQSYQAPAAPGVPTAPSGSGASGDDYLSRLAGRGPTLDPVLPPVGPPPVTPNVSGGAGGPAIPPWLGGGGVDGRPPAPPAGPSEYTRVISAVNAPPSMPASPPAPPAVAAPFAAPVAAGQARPDRRPTALLVGIVLVVVLILAVIVFFVLRSPSAPGTGSEDSPGVEAQAPPPAEGER